MYTVNADAILEIQRRQILDGQLVMNVFHYQAGVEIVDAGIVMGTILGNFETIVHQALRAVQSDEVTSTVIRGQWIYPIRYAYQQLIPADRDGALPGLAALSGASVVIRRLSDLAGHSHRGRIYLAGVLNSDITNSEMDASWMTANEADLSVALSVDLATGVGANVLQSVIWSQSDPANADIVESANVDPVIRYQRRRELGVGQ